MLVGDILKVRAVCATLNTAQIAVNVRHYRVSGIAGTGVTQQAITDAINTAWAPLYKPLLAANAQYRGIGVQKIFPVPPTAETINASLNGVGTAAGDMLPTQTCGLLQLRTTFAGPYYRGRVYLPFPAEGDSDANGAPTAGYVVNALALATQMKLTFAVTVGANQNTMIPIIWHRATLAYSDITVINGIFRWATQRRRGTFGQTNTVPF